jgi:hypothetical protein
LVRQTMMLCRSEGVRVAVVQASRNDIVAQKKEAIDIVGSGASDSSLLVRMEVASALCCVIDKKKAFTGAYPAQELGNDVIGWLSKLLGDHREEVKKIILGDLKCESAYKVGVTPILFDHSRLYLCHHSVCSPNSNHSVCFVLFFLFHSVSLSLPLSLPLSPSPIPTSPPLFPTLGLLPLPTLHPSPLSMLQSSQTSSSTQSSERRTRAAKC